MSSLENEQKIRRARREPIEEPEDIEPNDQPDEDPEYLNSELNRLDELRSQVQAQVAAQAAKERLKRRALQSIPPPVKYNNIHQEDQLVEQLKVEILKTHDLVAAIQGQIGSFKMLRWVTFYCAALLTFLILLLLLGIITG